MKLYLMGYMGCGKSTIGKKLAKILQYDFVDLDKQIEKQEGRSISNIFSELGEIEFRNLETLALIKTKSLRNTVISLGGGTPCFNNNISFINNNGLSVYIKMTPKALFKRLINARGGRPIIADKSDAELLGFIENQLQERSLYYEKAEVNLNGISVTTEVLKSFARKII